MKKELKIGWISDLHVGKEDSGDVLTDLRAYLTFACNRYDYVVITGDLVHYQPVDTYHQRFREVARLISSFGSDKIRLVPGNHDARSMREDSYGGRSQHFGQSAWGSYFGQGYTDAIIFEHAKFSFPQLNVMTDQERDGATVIDDEVYNLTDDNLRSLSWLVDETEEVKRSFIFTHFPMSNIGSSHYSNVHLATQILAKSKGYIDVLSGHWHALHQQSQEGFAQTVLPAFYTRKKAVGSEIGRPSCLLHVHHGRVNQEIRWGFPALKID